eukprot:6196950-Pleurochrysis_carterae.AAC.2
MLLLIRWNPQQASALATATSMFAAPCTPSFYAISGVVTDITTATATDDARLYCCCSSCARS